MRLDERFNQSRSHLNENDLYIWQYISHHRRECAQLSIDALGAKCSVSRTTILRFAQKLGLRGFSELKLLLSMEAEAQETAVDAVAQTCNVYRRMIDELERMDCTALFQQLDRAENLYVFSSGMVQSAVAKEMRRIFLTADKWFYHIHSGSEADLLINNITERDLIFILSVSGESDHVLKLARALQVRQIPMVSITLQKENTLALLCGLRLYIHSNEIESAVFDVTYRSTSSFFILVELLYLKYMAYKAKERDAL